MEKQMKKVADIGAFAQNVLSSVVLIFVNKYLMGTKYYGFQFAVTLSALHFLCSAAFIQFYMWFGGISKGAPMPIKDKIVFVFFSSLSIISLNLSLMVNKVGFYQMAKLLVVPFVCVVEAAWLGKHFPFPTILSILVLCGGVAMVTMSDVSDTTHPTTLFGMAIAATSIVGSGMQQILCNEMQKRLSMSSHQLLLASAWPQGTFLLMIGPFLDRILTKYWVHMFNYSVGAVGLISVTCLLALSVNLSQFITLGRFSAATYQVMGHSKTVLVLIGGRIVFNERIPQTKAIGMVLAVTGMVLYSVSKQMAGNQITSRRSDQIQSRKDGDTNEKSKLMG